MLTPSMCSCSPASSFPVLQKAGWGLGTRQHIHLGAQVSEIWRVIKTQMLLPGVVELLHEVSYSSGWLRHIPILIFDQFLLYPL